MVACQSTFLCKLVTSPNFFSVTNHRLPHEFFHRTKQLARFASSQTSRVCAQNSCNQDFSYGNLFTRLKSPPNLREAKRLHALLIVNGFFDPAATDDGLFGSQLVNVYVRFGRLQDAFDLFEEMPKKNNIAYNAILRGLVGVDRCSEAIEFFHSMLGIGIVPDNYTYPLVLKACSGLNDLDEGQKVHQLIRSSEINSGEKPNIYVECAMIDMFAKCGSLAEARNIFEEMPIKDLASWGAIICGSVRNSEPFEALSLLKKMREEGLNPDSVTVAAILPVCGQLADKQTGMAFQGFAMSSGFESDIYVSNALIDMYCKCGDTHEAYEVFLSIVTKDVVTWSTMIVGYTQNCQYAEGTNLYIEMKETGIQTNAIVASSVLPGIGKLRLLKGGKEIHGYMVRQGFECDAVIECALIDMYMNCQSERAAENIFRIRSCSDIMTFNSMITGYSTNGDSDSATRVFREIWTYKLRPNPITILGMLPLLTDIGNVRHGKEIHGFTIRTGIGVAVSVGNSLIEMYCKCGYLELGLKVFNSMIKKNIVTYNTVISAHATHGLGEKAISFFEKLEDLKIIPNKITFIGLLSACSHAGLLGKGWFLYNTMRNKYKIAPEMEHYSCMVDLLGRAGQLESAWNFMRRMPVEPDINVLGGFVGSCRVHNNIALARVVGSKILSKNVKDSGYHILLHDIYASSQRWHDASSIRTMIKEKGLLKTPGRSWIQIGFGVHIFHAQGWIHPESVNIYRILDLLLLEMKDRGYSLARGYLSEDFAEDTC